MNSAQQTAIAALKAAQTPQGVTFPAETLNADGTCTLLACPADGFGKIILNVTAEGKIINNGWLVTPKEAKRLAGVR